MNKRRGFLLGKFMPPHAGHVSLVSAAQELVDELTILVCWLPDDPIPGLQRLSWMEELFPGCRVAGHGEAVPQESSESVAFWPIWRDIIGAAHPEKIDFVFAGESYGADLARQVGGLFVPLGNRVLGAVHDRLGSVSASAIRQNPAAHWDLLPEAVRQHYRKTICLHGSESTGKSTMSGLLAQHFGTAWAGEYGRSHCEAHRAELTLADLDLIAQAQQAMIAAAAPWAGPILIADTDALMTAAWTEMLLGNRPQAMMEQPKADLYLLLEPDVPWVDDGTRYFAAKDQRARFSQLVEQVLVDSGVPFVRLAGSWDERLEAAVAAIMEHSQLSGT